MEIVILIFVALFIFAKKTNTSAEKYKDRTGFKADDDWDL